ncbi:MAG: amidase family protein, partial [Planctomycetota bacterium]
MSGRAQDRPDVSVDTIAAAERLAGIRFTPSERDQMRSDLSRPGGWEAWRSEAPLENNLAPAHGFDPWAAAGLGAAPPRSRRVRLEPRGFTERPADPRDVAFAPLRDQGHWLRTGQLTSLELTELYLERIARLDRRLEAVITVTADLARARARAADAALARGEDRGPLHGLPYAAKDLFDTAG